MRNISYECNVTGVKELPKGGATYRVKEKGDIPEEICNGTNLSVNFLKKQLEYLTLAKARKDGKDSFLLLKIE